MRAFFGEIADAAVRHAEPKCRLPLPSPVCADVCERIWLHGQKVRQFNQYIFEHSDIIASRSEKLTKKLH